MASRSHPFYELLKKVREPGSVYIPAHVIGGSLDWLEVKKESLKEFLDEKAAMGVGHLSRQDLPSFVQNEYGLYVRPHHQSHRSSTAQERRGDQPAA